MPRRRRSGAPVRRGTYQLTPWVEGPQRIEHPTFTTTRRPVPHQRRGRYFGVPVPVLDLTPPEFLDRRRLHIGPARRGRYLDPPWPQGEQGQAWPSFLVTTRTPPRPTRRGRYANPPWSTPDPGRPTYLSTRRAPVRPTRRGGYLDPPWTEGPQTVYRPAYLISRRARTGPTARGRFDAWTKPTDPVTNTPAERTYTVAAESRTYTVPDESRTLTVPVDDRD